MVKRAPLFSEDDVAMPPAMAGVTEAEVKKTAKPSKGEAEIMKTTMYLSRAVHDKLRDIAHGERVNINALVMEGLDEVLKRRSYPSTAEITQAAKRS